MKCLKVVFSMLVVSSMTVSCVSLDGQLDVKQVMGAKKKSGFLHLKTTEIKIQPDLYKAELKINSDKSYTLKLSGHENIIIPIKGTKELNVPTNGHVSISHNEINQPFDLKGEIATDIEDSTRINTVEECTRSFTENHCNKICELSTCKIVCKDEVVTIIGRHELSYHYRTINRDLNIEFLKADRPEVLATFHGTDSQMDRVIDYTGICR